MEALQTKMEMKTMVYFIFFLYSVFYLYLNFFKTKNPHFLITFAIKTDGNFEYYGINTLPGARMVILK